MEKALFRHLNEDISLVFSRRNRHLYAEVILELYREFFGSTDFRNPFRTDLVAFIAELLRSKPELWSEDEEEMLGLPEAPRRRLTRIKVEGTSALDAAALHARHV